MDIKNIDRLIAQINGSTEVGFNMSSFTPVGNLPDQRNNFECETVCCIAGHVALMLDKPVLPEEGWLWNIKKFLDIDERDAEELCLPENPGRLYIDITVEQATRVLENLKVTGEVDWSILKIPAV